MALCGAGRSAGKTSGAGGLETDAVEADILGAGVDIVNALNFVATGSFYQKTVSIAPAMSNPDAVRKQPPGVDEKQQIETSASGTRTFSRR
jgi:hypothetical protein